MSEDTRRGFLAMTYDDWFKQLMDLGYVKWKWHLIGSDAVPYYTHSSLPWDQGILETEGKIIGVIWDSVSCSLEMTIRIELTVEILAHGPISLLSSSSW